MRIEILGILIGSGLFIGGALEHDTRFNGDHNSYYKRYSGTFGDRNRDWYTLVATGDREAIAYWTAMAGATILTISLKHLWNQKNPKVAKQPYKRFRLLRDLAVGTGLVIGGYALHDVDSDWDLPRVSQRADGSWEILSWDSTPEEHWGFAMGALGAVWLGASTKHAWDLRDSKSKLDKVIMDFRLQRSRREPTQ